MRLAVILIAAAAIAAPAVAQEATGNEGPDRTADLAAQADQQRHLAQLARDAMEAGDWKTARKHAQRLADVAPRNLSAQLMLGETQRSLRDWKGARRTYAAALRLSPSSPEAHAGYGVALGRTGDAKAAEQLEWLTERAKACGNCSTVTKLKADVEAAIAAGARKTRADRFADGPPLRFHREVSTLL